MSEHKEAIERVRSWLAEYVQLRGLDSETVHVANHAPLLVADIERLTRAEASLDVSKLADIPIGHVERVLRALGLDLAATATEQAPYDPMQSIW